VFTGFPMHHTSDPIRPPFPGFPGHVPAAAALQASPAAAHLTLHSHR